MVAAPISLVNPSTLSLPSNPLDRSVLAMMARKVRPWPDDSGDAWVEMSARYVAEGLSVARMVAHRALGRVALRLGLTRYGGTEAARYGLDLRQYGRTGPLFGSVWRIPAALVGWLTSLLTERKVDWHPPKTSRTWWPVMGIDGRRSRGTCYCPHPDCKSDRPRCAWTRNANRTYSLTCQVCVDGNKLPLTFYGRRTATGGIEASLSHRAICGEGRDGMDVILGAIENLDRVVRSKRKLGYWIHPVEERAAERERTEERQRRDLARMHARNEERQRRDLARQRRDDGVGEPAGHSAGDYLCPLGTRLTNPSPSGRLLASTERGYPLSHPSEVAEGGYLPPVEETSDEHRGGLRAALGDAARAIARRAVGAQGASRPVGGLRSRPEDLGGDSASLSARNGRGSVLPPQEGGRDPVSRRGPGEAPR